MNKKPFLLLSGVILAGVTLLAMPTKAMKASASVNPYTVIEDSFNDTAYGGSLNSRKWVSKTSSSSKIAQSTQSDCYLRNNTSSGNVETSTFMTNRKVQGITKVRFDMFYTDNAKVSNKWASAYFVNEYNDVFYDISLGGVAYNGIGRLNSTAMIDNAASSITGGNYMFASDALNQWITIEYEITSSTTGTVNSCLQGGTMDPSKKASFTYDVNGIDLQNAYVGLCVSNEPGEIRFDNIVVENSGFTLEEDFSSANPTDPDSDFIYRVNPSHNGDLSYCKFEVIDNNTLSFKDAAVNDYIYSVSQITDETNGVDEINLIDASLKVKITKNNYKIGLVFGYSEVYDSVTKGTVVYEISKYNGALKQYDENGNQTLDEASNTNSFTGMQNESDIRITYSKKSGITITENNTQVKRSGQIVKFSNVTNLVGSFAIVYLSDGGDSDAVCYVDQVSVGTNSYYVPVTKSVTHNFSNDFWGNEGYEDFYVHDSSDGQKQSVKNGRLVWSAASDHTYFGSAHQYDDFILDFKLCSVYGDPNVDNSQDITAKNKWIGLDLSRRFVDTTDWANYGMLMTVITPEVGATNSYAGIHTGSGSDIVASELTVKRFNNLDANLFRAITYQDDAEKDNIREADAVCFRYVSEGGNITLYIKKASEYTYTKILTYYNLKLQGYFALCCTGYTYLELDDFSMANTSPIYTCADNESPETITTTETEIVYDNQNNDINLKEELSLYLYSRAFFYISIAEAVVASGAIAALIVVLVKKGKKHE